MKRTTLAVLCLTLFAAGCADLLEPAAAVVGGEKIPESQLNAAVEKFEDTECPLLEEQGVEPQEGARQLEQRLLSDLIRRHVLEAEARELDVELPTSEAVTEEIDLVKAEFATPEEFEQELVNQCVTERQVRDITYLRKLEEAVRAKATADVSPSDEDLRDFYNENVDQFQETRVAHIVVTNLPTAKKLASQLQAAPTGRVDKLFEKLARENSLDVATGKQGGDLGYVDPQTAAPQILATIQELDEGQISDPVQTQEGYEIIRLTGKRVMPFEAARPRIEEELGGQEIDAAWLRWLVDAYNGADIKVNPRYGQLDPESQTVVNTGLGDVPGADLQPTPSLTPTPATQPTP